LTFTTFIDFACISFSLLSSSSTLQSLIEDPGQYEFNFTYVSHFKALKDREKRKITGSRQYLCWLRGVVNPDPEALRLRDLSSSANRSALNVRRCKFLLGPIWELG
jgi:hypothetical protein